jgi:glycosyltransferase involved in cell wall biosynthesis
MWIMTNPRGELQSRGNPIVARIHGGLRVGQIERQKVESVLVVVPAFREEASVANVVTQIRALSQQPLMDSFAIGVLVVDDGSPDGTAQQARDAGAMVASLPVNLGVGAALQTGFRYAVSQGYQTVVTIDADGQHPVASIPDLLAVDAALVVGSRFVPGSVAPEWVSSTRSAAMGVLRRRLTKRTGVRLYDPTSGFRVIREPLLTRFALDFPATYLGDTFEAHLSAAAVLGADQIAEVSVPMKARVTGVPSSVGLRNLAYFARALLTTARPVWKPLGSGSGAQSNADPAGSLLGEFGLRFELGVRQVASTAARSSSTVSKDTRA